MGEIDTKPIESVQAALTFFEQSNEQRKNSPANDQSLKQQEVEKEGLERELASVKIQLEAKESAYKQALLKVEHYQKTADELSTLLKNSDLKKNFYINESREAASRVSELESALEAISRRLSESERAQKQLADAASELESTQGRLLNLEAELAILGEAKAESISQMQAMETHLSKERNQKEELSRQVSEMNEAITRLKMEGARVEREHADALAELNDLEIQLVEKSGHIESLQVEISQANELKKDLELQEKKVWDQAAYISVLEAELEQKNELKMELERSKQGENEAQVEIALLKFEVHKGRSRQAAAEAAEARAQSEKTALYNALQQMGFEAEETKKENRKLKEALMNKKDEAEAEAEAEAERHEEEEENKQIVVMMHENNGGEEAEDVRKELQVAMSKIGELRTRAEQAITRAEAAEKAKAALEEQNKKRREHKERRKAALAALRQDSISREFEFQSINHQHHHLQSASNYQPLGKVLNMKF